AVRGAAGEDVSERARAGVPPGLDDDDLPLADAVEDLLLGVEPAAVGGEQILARGDEAEGPRGAHEFAIRVHRGQPVEQAVVQAARAQRRAETGDGGRLELLALRRAEHEPAGDSVGPLLDERREPGGRAGAPGL